jgi:thiol-disulfide isomerase/thioredoxin
MDSNRKRLRVALIAGALVLAALAGAWVAKRGSDGAISYTEPSSSGTLIAAIPAARRPPAKDFAFTAADGKEQRLADWRGRVVLVNLWATWCPPCVAEMPSLDALQTRLGGPGFQVVAISLDRGGAPIVKRWFDRAGLTALAIFTADAGQFVNALLPTSYLIDAEGRVAWQGSGAFDWDGDEALRAVEALLAETRQARG